ncbi:type II secretion system F family protein [Gottfriedia acidiceleris]|uniref:type II secretion system F family protein n=1 Tax=Gottfriedia acidiceleris TaxID=371036 RepID=UPI00101D1102|nr:type II secretion system F family protein [Gottfriedia acidiceleris]
MKVFLELLIVSTVSALLFYVVVNNGIKRRRANRRINDFIPSSSIGEVANTNEKKESLFSGVITAISKSFYGVRFVQKSEKKLQEAGSKLKPEEFFALRIVAAIGSGLFALLINLSIFLVIVALIAGFVLPSYNIERKRNKRLNLISTQLIETLGMMANSMRSGFSFMQAVQLAGKEMPDPLGPEFERVVQEVGLGVSFEKAFQDLLDRLPNKELEVVVQAILAQRTSGGNIAELMETMEDTIRGRIRILEELKTLTAQGKMSSWIITLLPVGLAFYLYFFSPDYFRPMLHHPLGLFMIFAASISCLIGWFVIQKIIKIEV